MHKSAYSGRLRASFPGEQQGAGSLSGGCTSRDVLLPGSTGGVENSGKEERLGSA